MTQIKIITGNNLPTLESAVNDYLNNHKRLITAVHDIKFEAIPPPSSTYTAYIIYSLKTD